MARVLIIEDEEIVARMYKKALTHDGYEVELAIGGKEGIEKSKSLPDLILLDIMMPEPDGMEVLDVIKKNTETKDIPVVIFTNLSGKHDTELAMQKGAMDYLVKSEVEVSEMGERIKKYLNEKPENNSSL